MPLRRTLLFAAFFYAAFFAFAVYIGGDRLLATEGLESHVPLRQETERTPCLPVLAGAFEVAPAAQHGESSAPRTALNRRGGQALDRTVRQGESVRCADASPTCDSNGNVILRQSYMQAVYCAFVLGDVGG